MRWPGRLKPGSTSEAYLMTIDLLPTIANLIGAELPKLKIDGLDIWPLIEGKRRAKNPHESYFSYFDQNQLQAVISGDGQWKLMLPHTYRTLGGRPGGTGGKPVTYETRKIETPELYDLSIDVAEAANVAAKHPDVVARHLRQSQYARDELGESLTKRTGAGQREPGRVAVK
jgi:arylsulfatase